MSRLKSFALAIAGVSAFAALEAYAQGTPSSRYETRNGSGITRFEPPRSPGAGVGSGASVNPGAISGVGVGAGTSLGTPPVSGVGVGSGTTQQLSPSTPGIPRPGEARPGAGSLYGPSGSSGGLGLSPGR